MWHYRGFGQFLETLSKLFFKNRRELYKYKKCDKKNLNTEMEFQSQNIQPLTTMKSEV